MTEPAASAAETLRSLSRRVQRLLPCWQNPERFFVERSEVAAELRRLAHQAESRFVSNGAEGNRRPLD